MPIGLCSFATLVPRLRDVVDRTLPVWGLVVHTTGSGVVDEAKKKGVDPLEYAVSYYLQPDSYFAHYVVGYDGHIVQIADENERAPHVGFGNRADYLSGAWEKMVPADLVARWHQRWPTRKNPACLFPGPSPNNAFCGVELLPLSTALPTGSRYTEAQEQAVVSLARDIAVRWSLPAGWQNMSRLVGHEDLSPIDRPGWDPGALRATPWFRWGVVKAAIGA